MMGLLISCETGGRLVPRPLVGSAVSVRADGTCDANGLPPFLAGDDHARLVTRRLSERLGVTPLENLYSPALIDVGHSLRHRRLYPAGVRQWSAADKRVLHDEIYRPYRERVQRRLESLLHVSPFVVHLSIRTFESRDAAGRVRRADAGLLYDPSVPDELDFCIDFLEDLYWALPMLRVRRNYPGRGTNDSLVKSMRTAFCGLPYIGVQFMLNRSWCGRAVTVREEVIDGIADTLDHLLAAAVSDVA